VNQQIVLLEMGMIPLGLTPSPFSVCKPLRLMVGVEEVGAHSSALKMKRGICTIWVH